MTLFSYPATLAAFSAPKRHVVRVADDAEGLIQFTLEQGSRAFVAGDILTLSDYEYGILSAALFAAGTLIYDGTIDTDSGGDGIVTRRFPLVLADLPAVGGTAAQLEAPFTGSILSYRFVVTDPSTTAAKLATLQARIGATTARMDFLGINEIQTLTEGGSGLTSFTITFGGQTTVAIPQGSTAAVVLAALIALSTIGTGNVTVSGTGPYTVTFINDLGGTNVAAMTTTPTGGTGTMVVATATAGVAYTLALTSAGTNTLGEVTAGTLTDPTESAYTLADRIAFEVIAKTAFVEGEGYLEVVLLEA